MTVSLPAVADRSSGPVSATAASITSEAGVILHSTRILSGLSWTARRIRNLNLRAHLRMMGCARAARRTLATSEAFAFFVRLCETVESRSRIFTELHPNLLQAVPALFRMAAYKTRAIREPDTWQSDHADAAITQWQSLVSHLFEKWPVPSAFANAWFTVGPVLHIERDWFCHLAGGGSLRRLPGMPPLTASAAHEVRSAPVHLTAREALRWAQLRTMKTPEALTKTVLDSRIADDFANDGIWLPLIEKFIAGTHVDPAEFDIVTDGFRLLINESGTSRARELLRQPLLDLVRHWRKRWCQFLEHAVPPDLEGDDLDIHSRRLRTRIVSSLHTTWPSMHGVSPWTSSPGFHCRKQRCWSIMELCSQRQLLEEGRMMRHCVILYGRSCRKGWWNLFRMRQCAGGEDESKVEFDKSTSWTIRVDPDCREIVEIKGYRNRLPEVPTLFVIRAWARRNKLRFARKLK